jgi:MFS transporter, ACS family, tartrate transporter
MTKTAEISERSIEAMVITKLTTRLLPFLFLLYIVAYLDRINVGFAALQMQAQLGFSDRVYGLGAGLFFAGYFCLQVPSNLALARVGARRWIALIMLVWGVISCCMMMVRVASEFYFLRFALGAAEAGFFPGIILYLKHWFPASARARAVAMFMTAGPLAGVVGGPISGALLEIKAGRFAGWQWLFLLEGLPAIVLAGVVWVMLKDKPEEAHWLTATEKQWLDMTLAQEAAGFATRGGSVFTAFKDSRVWLLTLVYFGATTCSYGVSLWLPKVIRGGFRGSSFEIGVLSALPYIVAAIAMVVVGLHSDRSGERKWHLAGSAFAGAAGLWGAGIVSSTSAEIVMLSVALASFSMMGPFWAISTSILGGTAAAAGIALINSFGNLGGFVGPYVIGWIKEMTGGFRGGLIVVGAFMALSGVIALVVGSVKTNGRWTVPQSLRE